MKWGLSRGLFGGTLTLLITSTAPAGTLAYLDADTNPPSGAAVITLSPPVTASGGNFNLTAIAKAGLPISLQVNSIGDIARRPTETVAVDANFPWVTFASNPSGGPSASASRTSSTLLVTATGPTARPCSSADPCYVGVKFYSSSGNPCPSPTDPTLYPSSCSVTTNGTGCLTNAGYIFTQACYVVHRGATDHGSRSAGGV